ncbi:MAG: transposase [Candidatus Saccharimonas sp.]
MPTKNVLKEYGEDEYYHAYNRGVAKMEIFRDEQDYAYMLGLFKRHLSRDPAVDKKGRAVPHYACQVELVAYCLMPNHFHFLYYLKEKQGIEKLMRSMMTAYSRYFNNKYARVGPVFQSNFLAARITSDTYLWHVSRYIHLNPLDIGASPRSYDYSSLGYFSGKRTAEWLHPEKLVQTKKEVEEYMRSITDHESYHVLRNYIKHELAAVDE